MAIAISRAYMPKGEYFDREMGAEQAEAADLQATHKPWTASMTYGRLSTEAPGVIRPLRERYRRISVLWYRF